MQVFYKLKTITKAAVISRKIALQPYVRSGEKSIKVKLTDIKYFLY